MPPAAEHRRDRRLLVVLTSKHALAIFGGGGNSAPAVSFSDPLPGLANWFTASDPRKWLINIPRYATAIVGDVYPGIQAVYSVTADSSLTLRLVIAAGVDPPFPMFEITNATRISVANGLLLPNLGRSLDHRSPIRRPRRLRRRRPAT